MKPKRTLEEATQLWKKANTEPKFSTWLDLLVGSVEQSADRFQDINLHQKYSKLLAAVGGTNVIGCEVLLPALMNTCVDVGTCIGRIMYEENLPEGLEEPGNVYVN